MMRYSTEDLDDQSRFRLLIIVPYNELIGFVFEYLKKKSAITRLFWFLCILFLLFALLIRIRAGGIYPKSQILFHSIIGAVILPLVCIPVHESLHAIPYYLSGAKNLRIGMDLRQYLFYITAHRHVTGPVQFHIVAVTPFILISAVMILLVFLLPGLWKWSLSLFLFVHATMCVGDIALLNLYFMNRDKKIYTYDDVERKEAYFFEKL